MRYTTGSMSDVCIPLDDLAGWLTPTQVARRLNVSQQRVLQLAESGALGTVANTAHGRLFDPGAVEALASERGEA